MDDVMGPVLPCGCAYTQRDCPWLRRTLGRSKRQRPLPCTWMTTNGFVRSAASLGVG